jgi:hypothetical protein
MTVAAFQSLGISDDTKQRLNRHIHSHTNRFIIYKNLLKPPTHSKHTQSMKMPFPTMFKFVLYPVFLQNIKLKALLTNVLNVKIKIKINGRFIMSYKLMVLY